MKQHNEQKNYRWNYTVNLLEGANYWFGSSFIASATIFPLFISKLTPSLLPIGLVSVITSAGWFLPQLFSAKVTERHTNMKKIIVGWGAFLERLPIWMMVVSAVIARQHPFLALVVFMLCLTWFSFGAGVVAPAWMTLIAKIFSPRKRGSFLGMTMFIGSGMGVLGSLVSAWVLENLTFPESFIGLFGIAALFMTISWFFLSLTREPDTQEPPKDQDWHAFWRNINQIIKEDFNFRNFIITNSIITIGGMGTAFVTISAIQRFQVGDATVGLYTLTMMIGQALGYLVLGRMSDKFGHKLSIEIGVFALVLAFLLTVVMPSPGFYFVVYALLGIQLSSGVVSGMLVVWEFCDTTRVPTYSGLTNTSRGMIGLVVPLAAAQIGQMSYVLLFSICLVLTLIGLFMMRFWVKEPRWQNEQPLERKV